MKRIFFLVFLLCGCGGTSVSSNSGRMLINNEVILQGNLALPGRGDGHSFRVLASEDEVSGMWQDLTDKPLPEFNFGESKYVLYLMGANDVSPCAGLRSFEEVKSYISEEGTLTLNPVIRKRCLDSNPDTACDAIQVIEYPFYLIRLDSETNSIAFQEVENLDKCK